MFCRLELTAVCGREGEGNISGLGEESDIDTDGVRNDPLALTPSNQSIPPHLIPTL